MEINGGEQRWLMLNCADVAQDKTASPPGGAQDKSVKNEAVLKCAGGSENVKVIAEKVTLRFRPIAPKPVTDGSVSGLPNKTGLMIASRRPKRKYVRVRKNNRTRRSTARGDQAPEKEENDQITHHNPHNAVTLQLLPEKNEISELCSDENYISHRRFLEPEGVEDRTVGDRRDQDDPTASDASHRTVAESWITVESVTADACCTNEIMECTDAERVRRLDADKCPAFVSDGWDRVGWINEAYKKMVGEERGSGTVRVWFVPTECMRRPLSSAFTCRVRIGWWDAWRKESRSMVVPCDAWRMDGGGFAWRLDVEAALCLGR